MSDNSKFVSGLLLGALAGAALTAFLQSQKGQAFIDNLKMEAADSAEESLQAMLDKAKQLVADLENKLQQKPTV